MAADIIINGTGICQTYNLVLETVSNQPPDVFTSYIEVPGRDGLVDLSETGGLHYKNRQMAFKLHATEQTLEAEATLTAIKNWLHGHEFDFQLSWDIEYTYHGRFALSIEQPNAQAHQVINIVINAAPFKTMPYSAVARLDGYLFHSMLVVSSAVPTPAQLTVIGSPVWLYDDAFNYCIKYDVGVHNEVLAPGIYFIISEDDNCKAWSETAQKQGSSDKLYGSTWSELGVDESVTPNVQYAWLAFSKRDSGAAMSLDMNKREL